ncbi:MAG: hypothetical protein IPO08_23100 [Xanthomonadales bacterium]|nr:hypothetical protein [Xanthomonadales bacterium]
MKVWITTYALSRGVLEVDGAERAGSNLDYVVYRRFARDRWRTFAKPGDWHTEKESALARVEEMRTKKIAAIEKQLEKLKTMKVTL